MNKTPTRISVPTDADIFINILLYIDPKAAGGHSRAYRNVRAKLLALGWTQHRFRRSGQAAKRQWQVVLVAES